MISGKQECERLPDRSPGRGDDADSPSAQLPGRETAPYRRLPVLTNSQAKCFRRCAREAYLAYELGYRPAVVDEPLRFGSLAHVGLEAWWRSTSDRLPDAIEAMRGRAFDDFELVRAGVLLQGYDARWADEMEHYEVLAVEAEFRAPLVNPETGAPSRTFELGGKLDVVVRDKRDGLVRLIEHKTASGDIDPGSDYRKRLAIDSQVSMYFAGSRALGFDIAECIYDVIKKPALRPSQVPALDPLGCKVVLDRDGKRVLTKGGSFRQTSDTALGYVLQTRDETPDEFRKRLVDHIAENPERYYQRGTVVRLEQEEFDAAYDIWHTARNYREAQLAKRWPRNAESCSRWNRYCNFFQICTGTASLDDAALFRKADSTHEELSEAFGE